MIEGRPMIKLTSAFEGIPLDHFSAGQTGSTLIDIGSSSIFERGYLIIQAWIKGEAR